MVNKQSLFSRILENKIYYFLIALLAFVFLVPSEIAAQGMMNFGITDSEADQNLSDDEYEKLGEQWMELMMGDNHEAADEQMRDMMGEDFLRRMHIAMGKRAQNPGSFGMMPMLALSGIEGMGMMKGFGMFGGGSSPGMPYASIFFILGIISWISLIAFLLAGARWFWKRGDK